jgi:hypothetical protein
MDQDKKHACAENRKAKPVLSGDWYQWEEGGYKER